MSITPSQIMDRVYPAADALVRAGDAHHGLFPSMLDRHACTMLDYLPPALKGQRDGDRAFAGSNLMHDQVTLATLLTLDSHRPGYQAAVDRYLHRFVSHCTQTPTGLFPWGEHAYWHLKEDRVGNSYELTDQVTPPIHDHLRSAPLWLWEKLYAIDAQCVERFALGLAGHWIPPQQGNGREYVRHAYLDRFEPFMGSYQKHACDFPRHGGFYIFDWAFTYARTRHPDLLTHLQDMLDYWWEKREDNGLLLIQSREREGEPFEGTLGVAQTLSMGASHLEAAQQLDVAQPAMAATMRKRAHVYIDAFFKAPHDLATNQFLLLYHPTRSERNWIAPIWGSQYGKVPASYTASVCLCVYRMTKDERLLTWAKAVAHGYMTQSIDPTVQVPAMDAGLAMGLLAELYDLTRDPSWREAGMKLAASLMAIYFDDAPLPRGAAGIDWYESQMGPGFLLHGLTRMAMLAQNPDTCTLTADYTCR